MTEELKRTLADGLGCLGLSPTQGQIDQLALYCDRLLEKNQVMNLTAITDPADVVTLHFLDSAALLAAKELAGKKIIDVGTGGGFPGLVLKILEPTIQLTLLDTLGKRMDWLEEVSGELGLTGVTFVKGRAEEYSHKKEFRDSYDLAVSRALASMPMLAELCIPYVKVGGQFLAMKSSKSDEEVQAAEKIIRTLGGENLQVSEYQLPDTDVSHRIVTVNKGRPTPKGYPRKWTKIKEAKI